MFGPQFHQQNDLARSLLPPPSAWPVTQSSADPLELHFSSPTAARAAMLIQEFLGEFGTENCQALDRVAREGDSIYSALFEFPDWHDQDWIVRERETFSNRGTESSKIIKYTVEPLIGAHEEATQEQWRTGSSLRPQIGFRRSERKGKPVCLSLVAELGAAIPFDNRDLLAERWQLIQAMLGSETQFRLPRDLSDFVTRQDRSSAFVKLPGAVLKVAAYNSEPAAYMLLFKHHERIGHELETDIVSGDHLQQILAAAGTALPLKFCNELVHCTRFNLPLSTIATGDLSSLPSRLEFSRIREFEYEDGKAIHTSMTELALTSRYGDMWLTLDADDTRPCRSLWGSLRWDPRTIHFPKGSWARLEQSLLPPR